MKKKLLALLMTVAVAAGMLTGCGSTQETQTPVSEENKLTGENCCTGDSGTGRQTDGMVLGSCF